jgi:putative FmdB family regulatory protein
MPTYEFQCPSCGKRFERVQGMAEEHVQDCPSCGRKVQSVIGGGLGIMVKGHGHRPSAQGGEGCSLERTGKTCCGREQRCGKASCEGS